MSDKQPSLFALIGELPEVFSRLISAEVNRLKAELGFRARNFGWALLFVAIAGFISTFLVGALIATGIIALAQVMPLWLAALSVSGVLLVAVIALMIAAVRRFQRAGEDLDLTESFQRDVDAVKGMGPYDR